MKCAAFFLFCALLGGTWRLGHPTCVLESDFGFVLNCAFKKSGLFRVRNLGGIKAHVGLGFTVGDELGFKESLTNLEQNRRRSVQGNSALQAALVQQQQTALAKNLAMRKASGMQGLVVVPATPNQISEKSTTVPPFKPIPPAPERPIPSAKPKKSIPTPALKGILPATSTKMQSAISRLSGTNMELKAPIMGVMVPAKEASDKMSNNFAIRTLPSSGNNELPLPLPQTVSNSIQALSAATNISAEAIEAALILRQQKLIQKSTTTTTTTTTTYRPPVIPPRSIFSAKKVMNAPKEYYPVGYDKNFDDNFASRVDLPETSFHCGDQKHFPGLYADEDLGCMVFHVCALTDDGLIMKSFLCPESTLFDQTILKCNWWFYVECKNSKKLYDSNIPISKSYQLMKALTFFSSYKKDAETTTKGKEKD